MKKKSLIFLGGVVILIILFLLGGLILSCKAQRDAELVIINLLLEKYELTEKINAEDVLTVGKGKKFRTLQKAVEKASDGSVVMVFPGIYEESLHVTGKTLYIIGQSKKDCVLTFPNGNYLMPPIEMGSGMLANMTVYASKQELVDGAIAKAYSIHIDFDISKHATLDIIDVNFLNDDYQTVGIGMREYFTLRFRNCLIECKDDHNAFYCHDDPTGEGSVKQQLIVENCRFINNGTAKSTILLQSQEAKDSEILCEWRFNTVKNNGDGELFNVQYWNPQIDPTKGWQGMSFWKNSETSSGNSLAVLNEP